MQASQCALCASSAVGLTLYTAVIRTQISADVPKCTFSDQTQVSAPIQKDSERQPSKAVADQVLILLACLILFIMVSGSRQARSYSRPSLASTYLLLSFLHIAGSCYITYACVTQVGSP